MSPTLRRLSSQCFEVSLGILFLGQVQIQRLSDSLDHIVAVGVDIGLIFKLNQMRLPKALDHGRHGDLPGGPLLQQSQQQQGDKTAQEMRFDAVLPVHEGRSSPEVALRDLE